MDKMLQRLRGLYKYRDLVRQLVLKDIKLKYRRSFLGYIWSVLNPLLVMVVMYLVFAHMFRFDVENYPSYLIIGQTLFTFMTEATNQAIFSITGNGALLKKVYEIYFYIIESNQLPCQPAVFHGGDAHCIYPYTGTIFIYNAVYPGCTGAAIPVLPGPWAVFGSVGCFFPGYPVYLQRTDDGMDVPDAYFLPAGPAPGTHAACNPQV